MSWLSTARLPRPHDPERRDVAWTRWSEKAARPDDPTAVALLDALFGNSPYLTETALQNPTFMTDLWRGGPDSIGSDLASELDAVRAVARAGAPPAAVATRLRQLKRRLALNVAVADIAGVWPLDKVTGALSAFAAGCLGALTDSILASSAPASSTIRATSTSSCSTTATRRRSATTSSSRGISCAARGCWSS